MEAGGGCYYNKPVIIGELMISDHMFEAKVISLKSSVERRQAVEENLASFQYRWTFFDALKADDAFDLQPDLQRQLIRFGRALSPNEIGCYKSHVQVLKEFVSSPPAPSTSSWLLVLEDDVWLDTSVDFMALINEIENRGMSYLRLFARRWKPAVVVKQLGEKQIIRFRTDPYGTQAYLINYRAAQNFLCYIQSIDMPIDDEYGRFWLNGLVPYALFPFPVVERTTRSTIEEQRQSIKRRYSFLWILIKTKDFVLKKTKNIQLDWEDKQKQTY
jgi:glycosyl transferase family 25